MNKKTIETKKFIFKFYTKWNEAELLLHFRKEVLKNPKLYSNNNFGKLKPIKLVKSFSELNNYIQGFNFKDIEYPLYFVIAIGLKQCYERTQKLDEVILFTISWQINDSDPYKFLHELPAHNKLEPIFEILPKDQNINLWKTK